MNSVAQRLISVFVAGLVASVIVGCALAPAHEIPAQTGRVLDEETQQPIEGAIVVLRWQGVGTKAFVDTQTVCYHVESAESDVNGRYTTMPWKEESRYRDLSMKQVLPTVYKAGYRFVRVDRSTGDQYLRRDTLDVKERLGYLISLIRSGSCLASGESQRNIYHLRESIYYEAKSLGASNDDLQWMRKMAASAWLALDPYTSQREADKAEAKFLREHLQ